MVVFGLILGIYDPRNVCVKDIGSYGASKLPKPNEDDFKHYFYCCIQRRLEMSA
jgi:hypothetical protein